MISIDQLKKKKVAFISLGCDKNRVDLEKMIADIQAFGFCITHNQEEANILVINTCAFLQAARQESIDTILEALPLKNENLEKIVVTGCLPQYKLQEVKEAIPEIDILLTLDQNEKIVDKIVESYQLKNPSFLSIQDRVVTTPKHYAYLKIAEGCNNFCAYCTIPYIRGRYQSEPIEKLVEETKKLVKNGAREIILVAQDVTKYGQDLYGEKKLVTLLQELSKIKDLKWIRLLYCYPELVTDELIKEMTENPKICHYIDLPLQHVNDEILKAMNRHNTKAQCELTIQKLREAIPDIAIRTTFIIGLPGENNKKFQELMEFVRNQKLDNVGFFAYSREEGTRAYSMKKQVWSWIKQKRLKKISLLQEMIAYDHNEAAIGKTMEVVVDDIVGDMAICRNEQMAPLVDGVIYVPKSTMQIGQFYQIKITKVFGSYDLEGELV